MVFKSHIDTKNRDLWIQNVILEQITGINSIQFLRVYLDEKPTWKNHLNHLNSRLVMANFSLNRVKHQLPKTTMIQLYYTPIHPHLLYNIIAWEMQIKLK